MSADSPEEGTLFLSDLAPDEIAAELGVKPFQGRQIFRWIHRKRVFAPEEMTDLSKELRTTLGERCEAGRLAPIETSRSRTGETKKILFALEGGGTVESVLLRDRGRVTLCLSTQVGCALACTFCATGLSGFEKNLSAGEIVEQALHLLAEEDVGERTPNVVFMGMGEPFRNYEATVKSVRLLMDKDGLGIGARKITVSTVGEVEGIEKFAMEDWQVRLSVSLHAANDALRNLLVPVNRRYGLEGLMKAVEAYRAATGRQVTFEWTLMEGVNDSPGDAQELAALVGPLGAFVNLIPCNRVEGLRYRSPKKGVCARFRDILAEGGVKATLRMERGGDIDAACGQLRRRHGVAR